MKGRTGEALNNMAAKKRHQIINPAMFYFHLCFPHGPSGFPRFIVFDKIYHRDTSVGKKEAQIQYENSIPPSESEPTLGWRATHTRVQVRHTDKERERKRELEMAKVQKWKRGNVGKALGWCTESAFITPQQASF